MRMKFVGIPQGQTPSKGWGLNASLDDSERRSLGFVVWG